MCVVWFTYNYLHTSCTQGGFQLKVRALDADPDANDLIDYWIINVPTFLPTGNWTAFTTYYGETSNNAQFSLRYRLQCRSTWFGPQCNVRCHNINTDSAHLMCNFNGEHVCMEGWQDMSTQCTVRKFYYIIYTLSHGSVLCVPNKLIATVIAVNLAHFKHTKVHGIVYNGSKI